MFRINTIKEPEDYWTYESEKEQFLMLFKAYVKVHNYHSDDVWIKEVVVEDISLDNALSQVNEIQSSSYGTNKELDKFVWDVIAIEQTGNRLEKPKRKGK